MDLEVKDPMHVDLTKGGWRARVRGNGWQVITLVIILAIAGLIVGLGWMVNKAIERNQVSTAAQWQAINGVKEAITDLRIAVARVEVTLRILPEERKSLPPPPSAPKEKD